MISDLADSSSHLGDSLQLVGAKRRSRFDGAAGIFKNEFIRRPSSGWVRVFRNPRKGGTHGLLDIVRQSEEKHV